MELLSGLRYRVHPRLYGGVISSHVIVLTRGNTINCDTSFLVGGFNAQVWRFSPVESSINGIDSISSQRNADHDLFISSLNIRPNTLRRC